MSTRCSSPAVRAWISLFICASCLLTGLTASSEQVNATAGEQQPIMAADTSTELYLFAQYASGMAAPSSAPQLVAQLVNSTSQCLHNEAVVISSATAATDLIAAAKCVSSPLKAGLYNLQAAAVAGAAPSASWGCFNNKPAASNSSVSNATAAAAGPAAVPLVGSQSVKLEAGSSYTCIALYTPQAPAAAAAAAATAASPTTAATPVTAAAEVTNGTSLDGAANAIVLGTVSATVTATENATFDGTVSVNRALTEALDVNRTLGVSVNATVNGTASDPLSAANSSAETAATCRPVGYKQPPRGHPAPPLAIRGSQLVNKRTNRPVVIRGLNWFGFNVDMGMVDGLWAGGKDAATDFSKIAYQIRMLGFNAVRLPFVHRSLAKTEVWDLVRNCTNINSKSLKDRLVDPQDANVITLRKELPRSPSLVRNKQPGLCNTYLPMRNNEDRLLFVVQQFIALGMYVVLDYQPQGLEPQAYNLNEFVSAWAGLWRKVTCLPNFNDDIAGRVLIDVMNEPDSMGIRWEASGDRPGAEQLYLATADALWKISPNKMLFMFEGTGQNMYGLNWGNGFITDADIINSRGLSNPNSFFQKLVKKPYATKTIISPHLYPPSITKSTWLGEELWKQSNTSFGYLQSRGYCLTRTQCTKFPVVVGETGSAFTDEDDKKWLQDFADFATATGRAAAYNRNPLSGWLWWSYNENSGDTGGIVMNNWQDLNWVKLRYMMDHLGLQPWYKSRTTRQRSRRSNRARDRSGRNDDDTRDGRDTRDRSGDREERQDRDSRRDSSGGRDSRRTDGLDSLIPLPSK